MRVRWVAAMLATASVGIAQQRNFLACPIVRDTKTVPCFLAEYEGETYFLGIQQDIVADFHPPQLKHDVLVEGQVVAGPRVCGGIPLKPLSISVMKEVNLACNLILPAEPGIEAPAAARGAGPSSKPSAQTPPPARTGRQEFTARYSFDDTFLEFAGIRAVNDAVQYAKAHPLAKVEVTGYRSQTALSNGQRMVENPSIAQKRADAVAVLLRGSGVANVTVKSVDDPGSAPADRRVSIIVQP